MSTILRVLFPNLPPELRNNIYKYLSARKCDSLTGAFGLLRQLKTYDCKHTTVQICPVHNGSTGLLALQKYQFQEACEYKSWLLSHAVELRIGVTFNGRVNTFVQHDWDKTMEAHLRKLAKLHPWLKRVAKYDIQIFWTPIDGVMKSRKNKRIAGQIPKKMVATLTALMDEDVKRRRGDVTVKLRLDHRVAVETALSGTKFGLAEFLSPSELGLGGLRRQTRDVWMEPYLAPLHIMTGSLFLPTLLINERMKSLLVVENGLVSWAVGAKGQLVLRKHLEEGRVTKVVTENMEEQDAAVVYVLLTLLAESS